MAGRVVLSVAFAPDVAADAHGDAGTPEERAMLDELHLARIALSGEILVLNLDGHVGPSTERWIAYAIGMGKRVRFLEEEAGERYLKDRSHRLGTLVAGFAARAAGMEQPPATATGEYPCTWCHDQHFTDECPLLTDSRRLRRLIAWKADTTGRRVLSEGKDARSVGGARADEGAVVTRKESVDDWYHEACVLMVWRGEDGFTREHSTDPLDEYRRAAGLPTTDRYVGNPSGSRDPIGSK
jgi:hypothetical protein